MTVGPRPPTPTGGRGVGRAGAVRWVLAVRWVVGLLAGALVGAAVGLVWAALAPHEVVQLTGIGPFPADEASEARFAADAAFLLLGLGGGALTGALTWLSRRHRGPHTPVLLVGWSLLAALAAWQVGRRIGLAGYTAALAGRPLGSRLTAPVDVHALAVLGGWPLAAALTYLLLAGWSSRPDLGRPAPPVRPGSVDEGR